MAAFDVWRLPQRFQAFWHIGSVRQSIIITAEGRRFSFCSGPPNRTFWTLYCSGATTRVRLTTPSFSYVTSTYWNPASTTSLLDLPTVGVATFLKVTKAPLCYLIEVRSTVHQDWRLVFTLTSWTYTPETRCLTSYTHWRVFFLFGSPRTLCDLSGAMPSLHFDMTSSRPLRLHVDRGLEKHGYPWIPTDKGLNPPRQAGPTYQKTRRPVSGPCST
jgi:hypothetical protein